MSVNDIPAATISSTAVANTICGGVSGGVPYADTVTFTANIIPGASYQFFNGDDAPLTPNQLGVNTFATDDFSIFDTDLQFTIRVRITNSAGCYNDASMVINLNYVTADAISITGGAVSQNICYGTAPSSFISIGNEDSPDGDGDNDYNDGADHPLGSTISYRWQNKVGVGNWLNIAGTNSRTYQAPILYQTTQYRRQSISELNGVQCIDTSSNIITISVASELDGGQVERNTNPATNTWVNQTETICAGEIPQLLRVVNDTPGPGVDYQWQYSLDNINWVDVNPLNGFLFNATAAQYQPEAITAPNISSVSSFTITAGGALTVGEDFYRVTLGADSFTVSVGEVFDAAAVGSGTSPVDDVDEVLAVLEYKINQSGSGITAVDNAGTNNILITLPPGSTLTPTYLISDNGGDATTANSTSTLNYNAYGATRFYRRAMTQNFGGAILPLCQTFSDVHTVEVNNIIAGKVSNTDLVICYGTQPSEFTSERDAYSTNIGATISYQWYRTTDVARSVWSAIPSATFSNLTFTTSLTQSTSFRREATSTYNGVVCSSETDQILITVLDQVNPGFILANQSICRVAGAPLTVNLADLVNIVANGVESDDGNFDGINYQWQFSVDNNNWDDIVVGARADLLNGGFAATISQTTQISTNQQKTDIERRLVSLVDPDVSTVVYYRLKTTRYNDINNNDSLDAGEITCEVISGESSITVSAQPTLVQTTAPLGEQTVCAGDGIAPITFRYGGSATGIRLINLPGGLGFATDAVAKTITITGSPTFTGFVRVETEGTTCEIVRLQHLIRVTTAPQIPDYILIDNAAGGADPIAIVTDQDGSIYNGQLYLCERAISTSPTPTTLFSACYNDGRIAPLTESYIWYIQPPNAGTISATTGVVTWDNGFIGDASISVAAVGCDGSATATLTTVVSVNQFNSQATKPTEPVPLLRAESEIIYIRENAGFIRAQERYNVTINGVRYTFETTDTSVPPDGIADQTAAQIAQELRNLINNDNSSPISGLVTSTASSFNPGDANNNGLNDDVGGILRITALYDGNSAPAIPPGTPRGLGGDMNLVFNVVPSPLEGRAFGTMFGNEVTPTSERICGNLTGAEPICQTTAATPNTQYFSTASNYASIRYAISNILPGVGSVASPGSINASTGVLNWDAGFHGTLNIESYATGCDGVENANPGVHTVRIYPNLPAPLDLNYDPLTLPNCPAKNGDSTQFSSSTQVTWSWNNESAGSINSVTGLVNWAEGWSGSVIITATAFGCGGESLSRTITIPDSPSLVRISDLTTTNQNRCVSENIATIRYEILGAATGVDVTGIDDLSLFEQLSSENQVDRFVINTAYADAGDSYTLTIDQVPYVVTIGEDATAAGGVGVVDLQEEIVQVFVYKINQAGLGITAVNDANPGQFTLTSNKFDYSVSTGLNDVDGNEAAVTFVRTIVADGGTFIEISGTISSSLSILVPTTYQYTITSTGGTCTPTSATGLITVNPNSNLSLQTGMNNYQTVCNNSIGSVTPIIYDLTNALTVDVNWTPSRPAGINHTHVIQNQISTIAIGGTNAIMAANNGRDYSITINSATVTYTVNTVTTTILEIVNGLRTLITNADLQVDPVVFGGNSLRITSRNGSPYTISTSDPGINAVAFAAPILVQSATNSVTIFGNPAVVGLVANTVYQYQISTVNNAFGCNDPATQVSKTGSITITPQPSINLTSGSADLTICSGETVSSTLGGVDIEYDITGYALGATVSATSLPTGINTSYTAIPQITEISFAGNVANIDDNDNYQIIVNGITSTVTVSAALGLDTFASILQQFEALIDANVPQVDASYSLNLLTIQSNTGDAISISRVNNDNNLDGNDPTLSLPNVTQANRKFLRIFGSPTGAAAIYNYSVTTFGPNCDPTSVDGVIRVVDTPSISVQAGSNAFPNNVCNGSPLPNPIIFDVSDFASYTISWTGASGQPPGISLIRTTSSTLSIVSDPIVDVPGALPVGGRIYSYRITSTVNDNGCATEAIFDGTMNIVNGTATLTVDMDSSEFVERIDANLNGFDPSVAPDYVLIEVCQNTLLDDVLFSTTNDITNVSVAAGGNLPSGIFGDWNPATSSFRIHGTPDTATSEDIVLNAVTDACVQPANVRVKIVVLPASTIQLDPIGGSDNQIICNNTPLTSMSYTVTGALDASVIDLPNGVEGNFVAPNKYVISGTPNVNITETTSYTFTITTSDNPGGSIAGVASLTSCTETSITGVITVLPSESLTVSVTSGAVVQEVCFGEDITPIEITVVGENTFGSAINLPGGLNFDFVEDSDNMGGIVTISGSPSATIVGSNPVTYSFTVTTGGTNTSSCTNVTQQVDITVVPPSSLSFTGPDPSALNQIVCAGTNINEIEFTMGGGASNVSITFDAGLGFTRASNARVNDPTDLPDNVVIYGTAPNDLVQTTYNYAIQTVNQCNSGVVGIPTEILFNGTITVIPAESLTVSATSGATNQEVCINQNLTPIIYDVTGQNTHAKFVDASLVPSGITLDFAPNQVNGNGGVATILGSPDDTNAPGVYTFEITTGISGAVSNTSQCNDQTQSITITINPIPTLVYSGVTPAILNQSVCQETAITPISFTLGGGANDVVFSSTPGLGFNRGANISVDGNTVQLFGTAPSVGVETTYTYSISTVHPNSCTPSVTLGGSITVFPPVQYNNWAGNHTVNNPLCNGDSASVVVNPAAVSGGFVATKQQTTIELNNSFAVNNIITLTIGAQSFSYTVKGINNATGNVTDVLADIDRPQSKTEIINEIVTLINNSASGSTLVTAVANSPSIGIATLIAKTAGIGYTVSSTLQPGATPGTVSITTTVANQSLTYGYYWRRTNSAGVPLSTLDVTNPTTYVDTGLTLNLNNVTGIEYYLLTTVSNNCEADSPFVTITAPGALALTISSICDREIIANGSGGTGQLTYIIYNSSGTEIGRSNPTFGTHTFSHGDANNLPGGGSINITPGFQYQIGINDQNGCSLNGNDSTVQVNTPVALVIDETTINVTNPGCNSNDGSIQLDNGGFTITGGSAGNTGDYSNLTFLWTRSSGGTFNTKDIFGLTPADYTLTVTDDLCNTLFITSNPITITDTSDFTVTPAVDNSTVANCSDGHLQVSVTSPTTKSFAWTNQFGVSLGTTNRIENLDAGIYTLVVRDNTTGCEQTFTYTITGSSGPLQMIDALGINQANFTTTDILCNGASNGAFIVEFKGGNPPYQYSLNGAAYVSDGFSTSTSSVTTGGASATVVSYTTQVLTLDGLEGGTYSVKIKDSGLCTDDSGNPIELNLGSVTINEPDPLKIELNASTTEEIDCSAGIQGSLGVNITGGTVSDTSPYSILWELFGPSGEVLYKRTTSGSPSDPDDLTITGLDYAGDYTVTVTDANECSTTEVITLEDGSSEDPFTVGETPVVTQPGCNSDELGSIELELSGGAQPYDIKWYKLSVAQQSATSSTNSGTGTSTSTTSSSTNIEFSDGGYVSMNKDGFYLIDQLQPGKYRAIVTDATGCSIFSRSGVIKTSSFNMISQRVYNRQVLDCDSGVVEADFSFKLSGSSLAYNIILDGEPVYGGNSGQISGTTIVSPTFASSIVKQGNTFVIRGLSEGRHIVEAQDASNPDCSLDYAFDIETYVPITFEGETEFEFDVCDSAYEFELDTSLILGGNPIIDDNDNAIYNLKWTYTPLDPSEPGSSFVGRTNFDAGRGTYQLIISDGTCESEPIDFVFSGDVSILTIDGLLNNSEISEGVSCELGAQDGRISIEISGGQEPYDISWEIFDATSPVITPVSSTLSGTTNQINSPWRPLDGSYPGLSNFDGFTTLNDLPAGLYRYTIRSGNTCPNPIDTPFNYLRDVISVDDDNTLVITDGPYVDPKLCEGLPGLIIIDAVNNSDSDTPLNFFYINTNGTDDILDDGAPVPLNGNTTKLDEDTYQILIDTPFEYGKIVITTDEGCGVETEFNLALGEPFFSYTSPSFEQVNEIPAREIVTFTDESEGEFSRLEWNFGDNSELVNINISGTASGVTQVTHAYGNSGTYYPTLTIYNEIGCYESVTNPITIGRGYSIYFPNVFTPNNDCLNDFFRPLFTGFESLTFNIYDNKGNLIYTEEAQDGSINRAECPNEIDPNGNGKAVLGWDGKRADGSILDSFTPYYIYTIEGIPLNRVTDDQVIERSGIFTILK